MANRRSGGLEGLKDTLQAKRNVIVYVLVLAGIFICLAEWYFLPDQVGLRYSGGQLANFVDKDKAALFHLAMVGGFGALFWKWPREPAYLVGAVLGLLVAVSVLVSNLGLV